MIEILDSTLSTNEDAKDKVKYRHGDAVVALEQTVGRGQRGNKWSAEKGVNLTFSLVWEPTFLNCGRQFLLSETVALAIVDCLKEYEIDARIKWTNDIYVGDRKICGVLIEHDIEGANLSRTIVGIGLNVNQELFPEWVPNPTSMKSETKIHYDIMQVLETLYDKLMYHYNLLEAGENQVIENDYHSLLYRLDEPHTFATPKKELFTGTIRGVRESGALIVENEQGQSHEYQFKEIEFVI